MGLNRPPRPSALGRRTLALLAVTAPLTSRQVARGLGIDGTYACLVLRELHVAGLLERVQPSGVQRHAGGAGYVRWASLPSALGLFWTARPSVVTRGAGHLAALSDLADGVLREPALLGMNDWRGLGRAGRRAA